MYSSCKNISEIDHVNLNEKPVANVDSKVTTHESTCKNLQRQPIIRHVKLNMEIMNIHQGHQNTILQQQHT